MESKLSGLPTAVNSLSLEFTSVASTDAARHGPVRAEVKSTAVLNRKSLARGGHIDRW